MYCFAPRTGAGILTCYPSPTRSRLGLGSTHPTWTDLPSETLDYRRRWFSQRSRYSCPHSHSPPLHRTLPVRLRRNGDALLPLAFLQVPRFGAMLTAPFHFPRSRVRPVSCYALFQGWLLLSQPPGCLNTTTSFPTEHELQDLNRGSGFFPSRRLNSSPVVRLHGSPTGIRSLIGFGKLTAP